MPLTGPEKAVLMLLSLDEAAAAPIVAELEESELRKLRETATLMRAVPASALDDVYGEFVERAREAVAVPRGGVTYLRRLATRALGEERSQKIFTNAQPSGLERIARVEPEAVAAVMEREHPQLTAAVLSQLDPTKAAGVLQSLSPERQAVVVSRLASMTQVPAGLLEGVATALANELPAGESEASMSVDGLGLAAKVLRKLGKDNSNALLGRLDEADKEVADNIRRALHTFDDLAALDPRALRVLLQEVPQERLVLALKVATEEVKQKIFSSMSSRAAELMRDDLEALRGVRLADVEAAQQEIVQIALRLESEGTISLGGEEEFV
ncbi:MAG TPA: flagellar motor switch protein FliG [Polyangiaceae bacterium]|nr:flagellar motor switch protein FliG [Polyangiaceae bacterium]